MYIWSTIIRGSLESITYHENDQSNDPIWLKVFRVAFLFQVEQKMWKGCKHDEQMIFTFHWKIDWIV